MTSNFIYSREGYNFDSLSGLVSHWREVNKRKLFISDLFRINTLCCKLVKSYDRVVGLIVLDTLDDLSVLIALGNWSNTTEKQLKRYAKEQNLVLVPGELLSQEVINRLQVGL